MIGNERTLYEQINQVRVLLSRDPTEGFNLYMSISGQYYAYSYRNPKPNDCSKLIDDHFHMTVVEFVCAAGSIQEEYEREIKKFIELLEWCAGMAEQVDASDLKSDGESRAGSNPALSMAAEHFKMMNKIWG